MRGCEKGSGELKIDGLTTKSMCLIVNDSYGGMV